MNQRVLDILVRLQGGPKVEQQLRSVEETGSKAASRLGLAWTEASSAYNLILQVGGQVKAVVDKMIAASVEQERATTTLNAALQASGQYSQSASRMIQDYASELQRTVNVGDEAALSVATQISALTKLSAEALPAAMKATVQLAEITRMDLNSAGMLVAKTIEGNTGALGRYGIKLDDTGDKQKNLEQLVLATANGFDIAIAKTQTYEGRQQALNNSWGDFMEVLGDFITQSPNALILFDEMRFLVENLAKLFADGLPVMRDFFNDLQVGLTSIFTIGLPLDFLLGRDAAGSLRARFPKMTDAEIRETVKSVLFQSANEIVERSQAPRFERPSHEFTPSIFGRGSGASAGKDGSASVVFSNAERQALMAQGLEDHAQFLLESGLLDQNMRAAEMAERWAAAERIGAASGPRVQVNISQSLLNRAMLRRIRQEFAGQSPFATTAAILGRLGMDTTPRPGATSQLGRGGNAAAIMDLFGAYQSGGIGGVVGTGTGMVLANTLSAASLLGSAGGPVGMLLGTLVGGLFQKHQRETIRGPIEVEDKRVADILGGLNSTMNEMLRLVTAGGADRLFADAARQAVAL